MDKTDETEVYRIGTVSRLTGLSAHTLRKWEARYQALTPRRGGRGERRYAQEDVECLLLVKRLIDAGAAPREVAGLSLQELERKVEQLAAIESAADKGGGHTARAVILGSGVATLFEREDSIPDSIKVVASAHDATTLRYPVDGQIDVLICERSIVQPDTRRDVEALRSRLNATAAIIVYEFGARDDINALQTGWMTALRGPTDLQTLEQIVTWIVGTDIPPSAVGRAAPSEAEPGERVAPPRLPSEAISRIARAAPTIQCECPRHLADILRSLRAFEEYSKTCESRSPDDAALHKYLWLSTARARMLFEDAIERVAEAESIPLDG